VGKARAKEIIFQAKRLDAETAMALGIVDRVCEPGSLMEESLRYAASMQVGSPASISVVKSCINRGIELPLEEGLAIEMEGLERLLNTSDVREGVAAFLEKRKPGFRGK
jgi:enoyl-CoA hydratase/carnithine racemase